MKKLFIIGGMGAGKSTARKALVEEGLSYIDLDKVGHDVLHWDTVKVELAAAFGDDILDEDGEIIRSKVAAKAFLTPEDTRKLNRITVPRIEEAYTEQLEELEKAGNVAVAIEYSTFKTRQASLAYDADVIIAVVAPIEKRIERAVAGGWKEDDVRRRIAAQITDAERIEAADAVFSNDGSQDDLRKQVQEWWQEYKEKENL